MAAKRQPTNLELLREIKEVRMMVTPLVADVAVLKGWKHDQEIINAYEKGKLRDARASADDDLKKTALKTLKDLAPIITVLGMLAYAYLKSHGGG